LRILGPRCEIITPNIIEAQALCGFEIGSFPDIERAARAIGERFLVPHVLIKGGHALSVGTSTCSDWLWDGRRLTEFAAPRLNVPEARGTGCLLSSAIAAQRARGIELHDAIREAKAWLGQGIVHAAAIGSGRRVIVNF
jgi:hydroxymethylpyrimidine/phosphomethylpyrimidine kinase